MINSGMGILFAPNTNIMPIDFTICMKYGHITEHKTFIWNLQGSFDIDDMQFGFMSGKRTVLL